MGSMDLSIIIVNWNTRDLLEKCLQSVYDTVQGLNFEVFVVDNGSSDGSVDMVRQHFPQVRLIGNQENLGFARANNQAIRESIGRYVSLLNSDAFLSGDAIQQMAHLMEIHPAIGIVGANLYSPDGK